MQEHPRQLSVPGKGAVARISFMSLRVLFQQLQTPLFASHRPPEWPPHQLSNILSMGSHHAPFRPPQASTLGFKEAVNFHFQLAPQPFYFFIQVLLICKTVQQADRTRLCYREGPQFPPITLEDQGL